MKVLSAEWVLPISSEPIHNGAVAILNDRIVDVGRTSELHDRYPESEVESFGAAAMLPGFVNCHSHLEITAMRGYLDSVEHDFKSWLLRLNTVRSEVLTEDEIRAGAIVGAVEGASAGVTCFGDVGRYGSAGFDALHLVGLRGVLFQETEFSPDNKTAADDFEKIKGRFLQLRELQTELIQIGISPHSPYTVSSMLFEKISDYALAKGIKLCIHTAESTEEHELMVNGDGFFTKLYEKFNLEWISPRCTSIEFLSRIGILRVRPLLIHCVTASESDIGLIEATGSTIAHCPKSNAKFGHGWAPFERMLDAGIAVGLGSDSVASNNICDLLEESRFAALGARNRLGSNRFISAGESLEAATLGGAKALGLEDRIGTLEAGKQADITLISLENFAQMPVTDVQSALVFASSAKAVKMTMVAGNEIYRDGHVLNIDEKGLRQSLKGIETKLSSYSVD
ncbi:MAG: amidohydrolase family protein [Pyrinomonadaceae bacterium]